MCKTCASRTGPYRFSRASGAGHGRRRRQPPPHPHARKLVQAADEVYVSAASIWETCIKVMLGKLDAPIAGLVHNITASGFAELPVLAIHAMGVAELPPIHRDPFDRLLVAQAQGAALHLITADTILADYSPRGIVVPS